jgi:hypothetical protein
MEHASPQAGEALHFFSLNIIDPFGIAQASLALPSFIAIIQDAQNISITIFEILSAAE